MIGISNQTNKKAREREKMSVKKYRFYLLLAALITVLIGVLIFVYDTEQEKTYQDGTLVQNRYVIEEELA